MSMYINIGGGLKQLTSLYINKNGSNKALNNAYGNINGSKRQIFPSITMYRWKAYYTYNDTAYDEYGLVSEDIDDVNGATMDINVYRVASSIHVENNNIVGYTELSDPGTDSSHMYWITSNRQTAYYGYWISFKGSVYSIRYFEILTIGKTKYGVGYRFIRTCDSANRNEYDDYTGSLSSYTSSTEPSYNEHVYVYQGEYTI